MTDFLANFDSLLDYLKFYNFWQILWQTLINHLWFFDVSQPECFFDVKLHFWHIFQQISSDRLKLLEFVVFVEFFFFNINLSFSLNTFCFVLTEIFQYLTDSLENFDRSLDIKIIIFCFRIPMSIFDIFDT